MLRAAFNAVANLHSRTAMLKRVGKTTDPVMFTPARITPSNFFRFLQGPEYTTIKGAEFIIPIDTLKGEFAQDMLFSSEPTQGDYTITFGVSTTTSLNFDADAATVQAAVRLLTGLQNVIVVGAHTSGGFRFIFRGFDTAPEYGVMTPNLMDASATFKKINVPWALLLKKGDRIVDGAKIWAVDEIIEMHDLKAVIMGYRCRVDSVA